MWKWINNCGSVYFNFARPYFQYQQWWLKHLFYYFWMSLKLFLDNRIKIQQNIQATPENRKQYKWKLHRIFFFVCLCCLPYSKIYVAPSSFISRGVNTRRVKKSMKIINMKASYIIIFLYYINMFGKFFFIKSKLYFIFCKIKHDSIKFTFYIKNLHTHKNSNYFHSPTSSLFLLLLV